MLNNNLYSIKYFLDKYPKRSLFTVVALLVSGLAEVLSFAALIPLIGLSLNDISENPSESGFVESNINSFFSFVGVDVSIEAILLLIVFLVTIKSLLSFYAMKEVGYICADVEADFRYSISSSLMDAEWKYFLENKAGNLSSAIGPQVQSAANVFRASALVAAGIIQILFFSIMSLMISIPVTLIAFVLGFMMMMVLRRYVSLAKESSAKFTKHQGALLSVLIDGLKSIKTYKAMGLHDVLVGYLHQDIKKLSEMRKKIVLSGAVLKNFQEPIQVMAIAVGLYFLNHYWESGIEQLIVLILLFYRTSQRLGVLQVYYQQVMTATPPFLFVTNILRSASESKEEIDNGSIASIKSSISFNNIHYSYGKNKVLNGVTFNVNVGEFISLVGASGEGKTTLLDMLLGFNRPEQGDIMFDKVSIEDFSKKSLRDLIGYVPQETTVFHDTIKNNIVFGSEEVNESDLYSALESAGAIEFVNKFPEKLEFNVGEHGGKLSGGQKQRIGIARALFKMPKILILDEPTSALDKKSEKTILETIKNLSGKITVIAISHQQTFINMADRVLYLTDGKIIEKTGSIVND